MIKGGIMERMTLEQMIKMYLEELTELDRKQAVNDLIESSSTETLKRIFDNLEFIKKGGN